MTATKNGKCLFAARLVALLLLACQVQAQTNSPIGPEDVAKPQPQPQSQPQRPAARDKKMLETAEQKRKAAERRAAELEQRLQAKPRFDPAQSAAQLEDGAKAYVESTAYAKPTADRLKAMDQAGNPFAGVYLELTYRTVLPDAAAAAAWSKGNFAKGKLEIMSQLAKYGNPKAQDLLGHIYESGLCGQKASLADAFQWYQRAAEQGSPTAQLNQGLMFQSGKGIAKDEAEAARLFRKSAEQGFVLGQINLAVMLRSGKGAAKDDAEAARWFRKAAEQGNPNAQWNLGRLLQAGEGVSQDDAEAVALVPQVRRARVLWLGELSLAEMYRGGTGVARDEAEAAGWIRKAAEQGSALGQYELGVLYQHGKGGTATNEAEAVKWYRKAAEQGLPQAQNSLAIMVEYGNGVAKNEAEAVKWYRKAAEQGYTQGQINLAIIYASGNGVARNKAEAARWMNRAAEQGSALAQYDLGIAYENGDGVFRDTTQALAWYRKAAAQGFEAARAKLRNMGVDP